MQLVKTLSSFTYALYVVNTINFKTTLNMASLHSLEQECCVQFLVMTFKCMRLQGAQYISKRVCSLNFEQVQYNTSYLHHSYSYIVSHIWNDCPSNIKNSNSLALFCSQTFKLDFSSKLNFGRKCECCI